MKIWNFNAKKKVSNFESKTRFFGTKILSFLFQNSEFLELCEKKGKKSKKIFYDNFFPFRAKHQFPKIIWKSKSNFRAKIRNFYSTLNFCAYLSFYLEKNPWQLKIFLKLLNFREKKWYDNLLWICEKFLQKNIWKAWRRYIYFDAVALDQMRVTMMIVIVAEEIADLFSSFPMIFC